MPAAAWASSEVGRRRVGRSAPHPPLGRLAQRPGRAPRRRHPRRLRHASRDQGGLPLLSPATPSPREEILAAHVAATAARVRGGGGRSWPCKTRRRWTSPPMRPWPARDPWPIRPSRGCWSTRCWRPPRRGCRWACSTSTPGRATRRRSGCATPAGSAPRREGEPALAGRPGRHPGGGAGRDAAVLTVADREADIYDLFALPRPACAANC